MNASASRGFRSENAGTCVAVITEPGVYMLVVNGSEWSGAWAGCLPVASVMQTYGTGFHYTSGYVFQGECKIEFASPDDVATVSFYIMGAAGRVNKPRPDWHWAHGPIDQVAGIYAAPIVFRNAGITPEDVRRETAGTFLGAERVEPAGRHRPGAGPGLN